MHATDVVKDDYFMTLKDFIRHTNDQMHATGKPPLINEKTRVCVEHATIESPVYIAYVAGSNKRQYATLPKHVFDTNPPEYSQITRIPGLSTVPRLNPAGAGKDCRAKTNGGNFSRPPPPTSKDDEASDEVSPLNKVEEGRDKVSQHTKRDYDCSP